MTITLRKVPRKSSNMESTTTTNPTTTAPTVAPSQLVRQREDIILELSDGMNRKKLQI